MSKNGLKRLKGLMRGIKKLEIGLPKEADTEYFNKLEGRIMQELDPTCKDIRESLVDFCEGTLSETRTAEIKTHIDSCHDCKEEYKLTASLISSTSKVDTREETVDDYFATLSDKITEKAFEGIAPDLCDTAQDFIINMYTEETIPAEIKKHFETCHACKMEIKITENLISNLKKLSVPLPNEQYFEQQLNKIDAAIEAIPSRRIARSESRERITNYINGILDTFRATIMQPQAAIAVSALVALLIIGGKVYYSQDSIEERQINLSEVMNKTNAVATGVGSPQGIEKDNATKMQIDTATAVRTKYLKESISDPKEDEKLELRTTGSAENKKGKTKKVN